MTRRRYYRLTLPDREHLSRLLGAGVSGRAMARAVGRAPSSISRELRRLGPSRVTYWATTAQGHALAQARRRHRVPRLAQQARLQAYVYARRRQRWSPRQIAIRLGEEYPADVTMRVSHETIYRYLYVLPKGALKRELLRCLRRRPRYRQRRGAAYVRRRLVDAVSIDQRPPEVAARTIAGHWEGDLVVGRRQASAVGTLVERTTRFTLLVPLPGRDAATVCQAFARRMRRVPTPLAKTLTYDQGSEMAAHRAFTAATAVQVYFCHPHSPWERGTNENTNGLLRQFFPKGTDFTRVSARQLRRVQDLLNNRPRQVLDGKTPREAFYGLPITPVALDL